METQYEITGRIVEYSSVGEWFPSFSGQLYGLIFRANSIRQKVKNTYILFGILFFQSLYFSQMMLLCLWVQCRVIFKTRTEQFQVYFWFIVLYKSIKILKTFKCILEIVFYCLPVKDKINYLSFKLNKINIVSKQLLHTHHQFENYRLQPQNYQNRKKNHRLIKLIQLELKYFLLQINMFQLSSSSIFNSFNHIWKVLQVRCCNLKKMKIFFDFRCFLLYFLLDLTFLQ